MGRRDRDSDCTDGDRPAGGQISGLRAELLGSQRVPHVPPSVLSLLGITPPAPTVNGVTGSDNSIAFCLEATPGDAQGTFLALHSGITPSARRTIQVLAAFKASVLSATLLPSPGSDSFGIVRLQSTGAPVLPE